GYNIDIKKRLDLSTQILSVVNHVTGAEESNGDSLVAGNDTIYGGAGHDIVFGDHGVVDQVPATNRILTTGDVTDAYTVHPEDGGQDTFIGGTGSDIVFGGSGLNDTLTVSSTAGNLVLGDNGAVTFASVDGWLGDLAQVETTDPSYGGVDTISGGTGNDILIGGSGGDTITDTGGNNVVLGDEGVITYSGGQLLEILSTQTGADGSLYGGNDMITTGAGNDTIVGGVGADAIGAGDGDNVVIGDSGEIDYQAGTGTLLDLTSIAPSFGGDDHITTGAGRDLIIGGQGGDTIDAGEGNNVVVGDNGRIDFNSTDSDLSTLDVVETTDPAYGGVDTITAGDGANVILGGALGDTITAGDGGNIVLGDDGVVTLSAGALWQILSTQTGADGSLYGGDDAITTGSGADTIVGGVGNDTIVAGDGDNVVVGDSAELDYLQNLGTLVTVTTIADAFGGNDTIHAGAGADVIAGGTGNDMIDGGAGNDLIFGDNVNLDRTSSLGTFTSPLFRQLTGSAIYDPNTGLANVAAAPQLDPQGPSWWSDFQITLLDLGSTAAPGTYGDDYIAGGAGNDIIFGENGNDVIQGDGSIDIHATSTLPCGNTDSVGANNTPFADLVGACRDSSNYLRVNPSADNLATDGNDYIEGGAGSDTIFGNQGQDDILGGSSNLFGQNSEIQRPDSSNMLFGGSGTEISYDNAGDTSANGNSNDSDAIVANNGLIYDLVSSSDQFLAFNYVSGVIPRAVTLLDYTYGGPDYNAAGAAMDVVAASEIHGEAGDDFIYGGGGNDVLYGDGQNDTIVGGYGNDWISGGTGDDGILGDDGRILASIEGTAEPLNGIGTLTDPNDGATADLTAQGTGQEVIVNPVGTLTYTALLIPYDLGAAPKYANDIIYGGLGNDSIHGGSGDDAISGAEAPVQSYANNYDANGNLIQADIETDWYHPFNPGNALGYSPALTYQAQYDPNDPLRKILLTPGTGALYKGAIDTSTEAASENKAGAYLDWFLNFDATDGPLDTQWFVGSGYPAVPTDGNDHLFGDNGNDWLVGGTGRDSLFGGMGNDLLNADDNLNTANGTNLGTDTNPSYEDIAYGGGGLDVLIANTGGDRLIDWGGEYNSFLVPFSPFGMATVDRAQAPAVQNIVTQLALSEGADPMLGTGALAEIGLSIDHGGPRDPQPGNSHGSRDVLRSAGTLVFDTPAADPPAGGAGVLAQVSGPVDPTIVSSGAPVQSTLPLTADGPSGATATYTVTDVNGKSVTGAAAVGATTPVDVSGLADGTLTVKVVETDLGGNTSTVTTTWLKDTTRPTLTGSLSAPNNGTSYDVGTPIVLTWTASDGGSGVSATSGAQTIDVDSLMAGTNTVSITVADKAGNVTTVTLTFQVHATLTGLVNAVNDGVARGYITQATASSLISTLQSAMKGNSAHAKLPGFISAVQSASGKTINAAYATLLLSWANDLLSRS
ncbi:MAG: beta strand repeat-containing protein, partial [Gaiellaceae bacterium]